MQPGYCELQLGSQVTNFSHQNWLGVTPSSQSLPAKARHIFLLIKLVTLHIELCT